jgi:hypothetical protein
MFFDVSCKFPRKERKKNLEVGISAGPDIQDHVGIEMRSGAAVAHGVCAWSIVTLSSNCHQIVIKLSSNCHQMSSFLAGPLINQ